MRENYNIESLKRAVRNPILIARELVRVTSFPFHSLYGKYFDYQYPDGVDVIKQDWDNLIILDACRFDYFEDQNRFEGELEAKISRGMKSWEFMESNFAERELYDTVYITANPFVSRLDNVFFEVNSLIDQWDDEVGTVQPENVVKAALEAHQEYPNKRLIIHFMQPHRPYLGETAERLRDRVDLIGYQNEGSGLQIWGAAKQKNVTVEEVRQAYSESLNIVLEEVDNLLEELGGKSVITSDHGEMLGERIFPVTSRVWGHSEGFSTPQLRKVPWFTIEDENRRKITREEPISTRDELNDDVVSDRLRALGYRDE